MKRESFRKRPRRLAADAVHQIHRAVSSGVGSPWKCEWTAWRSFDRAPGLPVALEERKKHTTWTTIHRTKRPFPSSSLSFPSRKGNSLFFSPTRQEPLRHLRVSSFKFQHHPSLVFLRLEGPFHSQNSIMSRISNSVWQSTS